MLGEVLTGDRAGGSGTLAVFEFGRQNLFVAPTFAAGRPRAAPRNEGITRHPKEADLIDGLVRFGS